MTSGGDNYEAFKKLCNDLIYSPVKDEHLIIKPPKVPKVSNIPRDFKSVKRGHFLEVGNTKWLDANLESTLFKSI